MASSKDIVYVGIDIAKRKNDVQVELPNGRRQRFTVVNRLEDFERLNKYLSSLGYDCDGTEPLQLETYLR